MNTVKARRPRLHPVTLAFGVAVRERNFLRDSARSLRGQQRIALSLGALLWTGLGIQDPWFFPDSYTSVWLGRLLMGGLLLLGLAATFRPWWITRGIWILVALYFLSVLGPGLMMLHGGPEVVAYYHQGILLSMFWAAIFAGLRFVVIAGCCIGASVFATLLLTGMGGVPMMETISVLLILLSTAVMGGFGAYLLESQRRQMFHYNVLLDRDRRSKRLKALKDPLTGLSNRTHMEQRAAEAMARARRHATGVGVLFLDLDHFKPVNDTWGHKIGDGVLRELADRLSGSIRCSDTVARVGGDEFVVLVEDIADPDMLNELAAKLGRIISTPIPLPDPDGRTLATVRVTASIGCSYFPRDGVSLDALIHHADTAMYSVKATVSQDSAPAPGQPAD